MKKHGTTAIALSAEARWNLQMLLMVDMEQFTIIGTARTADIH